MVSESLNAPVQPFEELWHFVKPASAGSLKWLVAGIQQL
jgi:predicted lipid-binding transport protein (Tim44 family)